MSRDVDVNVEFDERVAAAVDVDPAAGCCVWLGGRWLRCGLHVGGDGDGDGGENGGGGEEGVLRYAAAVGLEAVYIVRRWAGRLR